LTAPPKSKNKSSPQSAKTRSSEKTKLDGTHHCRLIRNTFAAFPLHSWPSIEEVERELKIHAIKLAPTKIHRPVAESGGSSKNAVADSNRYPTAARTCCVTSWRGSRRSHGPDFRRSRLQRNHRSGLTHFVGQRKNRNYSYGSYAPFSLAIRASGAELVRVPQRGFSFDLPAIADAVLATAKTRLVYLANPTIHRHRVRHVRVAGILCTFRDVLVVLDEAYIHYADRADMPDSVQLFASTGIAGHANFFQSVRLGRFAHRLRHRRYAVLEAMNRLRTPFNLTGVSQAAALAALDDAGHVNRSIQETPPSAPSLPRA